MPALRHNFRTLRQHLGPRITICSVVKCDAYGHGYAECARALQSEGARWFGVTSTDEGVAMREAGITGRILIMVGAWRGEEEDVIHYGLTPAVSRFEEVNALAQAAERLRISNRLPVHLKLDTGMGRLGLPLTEIESFAERARRMPQIDIEGVFSHLASSEVLDDPGTLTQSQRFAAALQALADLGIEPQLRHLANSSAAIGRPDTWYNFVRPGLALYGYELPPVLRSGTPVADATHLPLEPVLSWKTRVISLRDVPAGQALGYGGTYTTRAPARIAVIAAGYGDGYPRRLSNPAPAADGNGSRRSASPPCVLVRGQRAPIVGRVAMDMTLVDVSHIVGCEIGDEVVLIGGSGTETLTAWDIARWSDTLPYEILCNLSERVLRRYAEGSAG